jgi:hypothetical protein
MENRDLVLQGHDFSSSVNFALNQLGGSIFAIFSPENWVYFIVWIIFSLANRLHQNFPVKTTPIQRGYGQGA